jgi:uncharacterized membrane protein YesL
VLWAATVGLFDETSVLVRGNLAWVALTLPLYLVVLLILLPFAAGAGDSETNAPGWPFVVSAWLVAIMPTPGGYGLARLARAAAAGDAPRFQELTHDPRSSLTRGTGLFLVSTLGCVLVAANGVFYLSASNEWVKLVAILWLYAGLFWIALQTYLLPLALYVERPRVPDLYRRAAVLTIAHPMFSILIGLMLSALALVSALALPVYLLLTGAFVALARAHAFRLVRRQLGDLTHNEEHPA